MTILDLNRRLAEALGWTNIIYVGNALLGMPPWGIPEARGQAKVPNWAGDWRDCGPLIAQYRIAVEHNGRSAIATHNCHRTLSHQPVADEGERDLAGRIAIVDAVIAKLEAGQ